VCRAERAADREVAARSAARGIDPPHGLPHVSGGQAEALELIGTEVLPGDGLLRAVPMRDEPTGARAAERAIAVVDEERCGRVRHSVHGSPWYADVVLRLIRPSADDLTRLLAKARAEELSYPEVGATRDSVLPAGYRLDRYERRLGPHGDVFERAVHALREWRAHTGAGVEVVPPDAPVAVGETVVLVLETAGIWAPAPCRVVYVVDEPSRFSFAYGTLPGHPERGEVAMIVERTESDDVVFRIVSFSRTVDPLARLGSPLTRLVQRRVTNGYLRALADAASAHVVGIPDERP
jgi:uncharacterized protein (UPF0548 family)